LHNLWRSVQTTQTFKQFEGNASRHAQNMLVKLCIKRRVSRREESLQLHAVFISITPREEKLASALYDYNPLIATLKPQNDGPSFKL